MRRFAAVLLIVAALSGSSVGDMVVLKDGRVFEGTVTESDGKIFV